MAATLTADNELTYFSFPIVKQEETPDGDIVVWGKCTDGSLDRDLQVVDPQWSQAALKTWLDSGANLRVQHQAQRDPAGKGLELDFTDDGHWLKGLVVEPVAKELVRKGVLTAYSIGIAHPQIDRDPTGKALNGIIRGGEHTEVAEISLVDRPSNRHCGITLVKAAEADGSPEYVGKAFGDTSAYLAKTEGSVSEPTHTFTPADMAKVVYKRQHSDGEDKVEFTGRGVYADDVVNRLAAALKSDNATVGKRDMDPNVGGGVDRDKIPAADFAGRNRSFPIVTPGDVSDAAASIGRAGDDNYSSDKLKHNIIAIAQRKGPAFVAELPDSWKPEGHATKADGPAPYHRDPDETVQCPACDKYNAPDARWCDQCGTKLPASAYKESPVPDIAKGAKDCPSCGKTYHADSKQRTCENCGADLPNADAAKTTAGTCPTCKGDGSIRDGHVECPDCHGTGKLSEATPDATKAESSSSDTDADDDSDDDDDAAGSDAVPADDGGTDSSDGDTDGGSDADSDDDGDDTDTSSKQAAKAAKKKGKPRKGSKPTPGDHAQGKDTTPVPAHREPDGPQTEMFEEDSHMEDGDAKEEGDTENTPTWEGTPRGARSTKTTPIDYRTARLHDVLCAAYSGTTIADTYPSLNSLSDAVTVKAFEQAAITLVSDGRLIEAQAALAVASAAKTLTVTDPQALADARARLHKAFEQDFPDVHLSPETVTPGKYRRPYLSAGHPPASAAAAGSQPSAGPTFREITADDFTRGPLTAGHEAPSPGTKGDNSPAHGGPVTYATAQVHQALNAMTALHDHIAAEHPILCPLAATGLPQPAGQGSTGVFKTSAPGNPPGAAKAVKVKKKAKKVKHPDHAKHAEHTGAVTKTAEPAAPAFTADQVQSMVTKAVADALTEPTRTIASLQQQVDELGRQPDPNASPVRGILAKQTNAGGASAVDRRSLVDEAINQERAEKIAKMNYLRTLTKSGTAHLADKARTELERLQDEASQHPQQDRQ